jgi:peptidoglycan/xylan/chitin deacetylase (PgdA/CDA1 family)
MKVRNNKARLFDGLAKQPKAGGAERGKGRIHLDSGKQSGSGVGASGGTGGSSPHLQQGKANTSRRPLIIIAAGLGVLLLVVAAIVWLPGILRLPVKVSLNGKSYRAQAGIPLAEFVAEHLDMAQYHGDLLAVDGSILKKAGGVEPLISINGRAVEDDDTLRGSENVLVTRGADVTEKSKEKLRYESPAVKRTGRGSFGEVSEVGRIGVIQRRQGSESGLSLPPETREETMPVTIRMVSADKVRPKVVALTYDDGPSPKDTEALLKVLAAEQVKATFFMIGRNVKSYPAVARKVAQAGHQVAGHSYAHDSLPKLKPPKIEKDLEETARVIEEATGVHPLWMRPPYGAVNGSLYTLLGEKQTRFAMWDIDPLDWRRPGAKVIAERVLKKVRPGAVVLLHDGSVNRAQTVEASKIIIAKLKKKGYRFVTMQELYVLAQSDLD